MIKFKEHQKLIVQLVMLLLLSFGTCLRGSHLVGGEITYECLGNNTYNIHLRLFRDCSGNPLPGAASISVRTGAGSLVNTFNALSGPQGYLQINKPACATISPNFCVQTAVYSIYGANLGPSSSGFSFTYQLCCRNANISNVLNGNSYGATFTSSVVNSNVCNNSAYFNNNPPLVIPFGFPITINASALDTDGDSLYYEFCSPLRNTPLAAPFDTIPFISGSHSKRPISSNPQFSIHSNTGIITGTVTGVGNYLVAICVSEFRNGVYIGKIQRDYQFNAIQAWALSATVPVDSIKNPSCKGAADGRIALMLGGGKPPFTYLWSNNATTSAIGGLSAGTYSVVITDSLYCTDTVSVTLTNPQSMSLNVVAQTPASCATVADGSASVAINGGTPPFSIAWSGGGSGNTRTNLSGGQHSIFVTDSNGCQDTFDITISELNGLTLHVDSIKNVSCNDGNDGFIKVLATGAVGILNYSWAHGPTFNTAANLTAGNYSITVSDSKGCTASAGFSITEPSTLMASVDSIRLASCQNVPDGEVYFEINGGTPPYRILAPGGMQAGNAILKMATGQHQITIKDSLGCVVAVSAFIDKYPPLEFSSLELGNPTCPNGDDGFAVPMAIGGQKPYTFHWSNGQTGAVQERLKPGWYEVSVVDRNQCTLDTTFYIAPGEAPVMEIVEIKSTCMEKADASLEINIINPSQSYQYYVDSLPLDWVNGQLLAGVHHIMAVSNANCAVSEYYQITSEMKRAVFFPTAFTPNGDGLNDKFEIWGDKDCFPNSSLTVFNRWGEVVYISHRPFDEAWNGMAGSGRAPAQQDTYLYKFESDHFHKQGAITIFY